MAPWSRPRQSGVRLILASSRSCSVRRCQAAWPTQLDTLTGLDLGLAVQRHLAGAVCCCERYRGLARTEVIKIRSSDSNWQRSSRSHCFSSMHCREEPVTLPVLFR